MASQQKTPTILCKYANLYAKIVHVTNKQTCTSPHYIVFIMNTVTKTKDMQITLQQQHNAAPTLTARFTAQQYTKYQHTISHSDHIYKHKIQNLNKCLICHYTPTTSPYVCRIDNPAFLINWKQNPSPHTHSQRAQHTINSPLLSHFI